MKIESFLLNLGHEAIVEILLQNGANVNGNKRNKWTPLNYAAFKGTSVNV